MPRPKTVPQSPYDIALRFMVERVGPEPLENTQARHDWREKLALAADAIAFALKEVEKETP